jgi:pyruvate,water dikinase
MHVSCLFAGVQPLFDQVVRLAEQAGDPELAARLMAGQGSHAELAMVGDLWSLSRETLSLDGFLARHGYHGPLEGEIASRVWREDASPVTSLAERYRASEDSPDQVADRNATARATARASLMRALPPARRAQARLVLALADRYLPLRGVGKVAFLQTLDVARAATRRIGTHLAAEGLIADPEDVFYLVEAELLDGAPPKDVAQRRKQRDAHLAVRLPSSWRGRPEVQGLEAEEELDDTTGLTGVGASPGTVEGIVRVVLDPTFDDVESGEILVAPTTDPSWASVLFTAAALVVDLGGQLSHAAVVARELGIPCVMGTGDGTRRLRTGDRCRVDGHAGTVEVLERATTKETST